MPSLAAADRHGQVLVLFCNLLGIGLLVVLILPAAVCQHWTLALVWQWLIAALLAHKLAGLLKSFIREAVYKDFLLEREDFVDALVVGLGTAYMAWLCWGLMR